MLNKRTFNHLELYRKTAHIVSKIGSQNRNLSILMLIGRYQAKSTSWLMSITSWDMLKENVGYHLLHDTLENINYLEDNEICLLFYSFVLSRKSTSTFILMARDFSFMICDFFSLHYEIFSCRGPWMGQIVVWFISSHL